MRSFLSNYAAEHVVLPLDVALYRACKDRHGSKAAIAEIYGFNAMTFSKAVDVNNDQFHLKPEQIEAITSYTKDIRILQSLASVYDNVVIYQYQFIANVSDFNFLANIGEVSNKVGELFNGLSESLKDHVITEIEMAMIEKHAMELISAVAALKNIARMKSDKDFKNEEH